MGVLHTLWSALWKSFVATRGSIVGTPAADDLWSKVAAAVRAQLNESTWNTWFQGVHARDVDDERLVLNAPSSVAAERIRTSYSGLLADAVNALTGVPREIEILVVQAPRPEMPVGEASVAPPARAAETISEEAAPPSGSRLDPITPSTTSSSGRRIASPTPPPSRSRNPRLGPTTRS